jgi:hypothetical protein
MAPRRVPYFHLQGRTLRAVGGPGAPGPFHLSACEAAVFEACDGERTARSIAADGVASHPVACPAEASVYEALASLRAKGTVRWAVEVPRHPYPEAALRATLERVGDDRLRQPSLAALDELERARTDIVAAAGDLDLLDRALEQIDRRSRASRAAPRRAAPA